MAKPKIKLPPSDILYQNALVDHQIEQFALNDGLIQPFDRKLLSGCAYDLRAGSIVRSRNRLTTFKLSEAPYIVESGECITVETLEQVNLANNLFFAFIVNKHSILAKGFYHPATVIDPGFTGTLALTFINSGNVRFELALGDKIAKVVFSPIAPIPGRIYGLTQKPSYSEGSTDIALIVDTPRQLEDDAHLSKMYGRPVEKLYDEMKEIKAELGLIELKRDKERRDRLVYIFWGIVFALISGLSGSLLTANWDFITGHSHKPVPSKETQIQQPGQGTLNPTVQPTPVLPQPSKHPQKIQVPGDHKQPPSQSSQRKP